MLLKQTLLYLPAQVLGPIVQFISVILWTYFLSPEEMGVFALVSAAQELVGIATLQWFTLYTVRFFDRRSDRASRDAFLNTEAAVAGSAMAGTALAVLSLPVFMSGHWDGLLVSASLAYCLSRVLATHLADRARTGADTVSYSVLQILWPAGGLAFGLLLVKAVAPTAAMVLWGYAVAQILALALVAGRMPFSLSVAAASADMMKAAVRYGLPLVAGGVFVWLANNGIRFILEHNHGAAAVGLVTVGWGLGLRAAAFAAMLVTAAAFPLAVTRSREQGLAAGQAQLVTNGVLLLAVLAPAAAGLWAISGPLVERVVAPSFREMTAAVLPWAILAGALRNIRMHFGEQIFLLREDTMASLANNVIDGVATLVGAAIGLELLGLPGSVVGAAAGAGLGMLVTLGCGAYWYGFGLPLSHLARIGGATAFMVMLLKSMSVAPMAASLTLAILVGGAGYAAAMALLYPEAAQIVVGRLRRARDA